MIPFHWGSPALDRPDLTLKVKKIGKQTGIRAMENAGKPYMKIHFWVISGGFTGFGLWFLFLPHGKLEAGPDAKPVGIRAIVVIIV